MKKRRAAEVAKEKKISMERDDQTFEGLGTRVSHWCGGVTSNYCTFLLFSFSNGQAEYLEKKKMMMYAG